MFKRFWWMFLVMLPAGAFAGFVVAAVFSYIMPKMYESEAVIEVKSIAPLAPQSGDATPPAMTPQFFGTEYEIIKSRSVLEKVVDAHDLTARWDMDKESAVQVLKAIVTAQNIRGTDLISIRVRYTNKTDVRDIAAGVVDAYKKHRREIESRDAKRQLDELNKAIRDQEGMVEEGRKILSNIARTKGIIYRSSDSFSNQSGLDEGQEAKNALDSDNQLVQEKGELESKISNLLKYDGDRLMSYASGLEVPGNVIKDLYPKYLEAKRKVDVMQNSGIGNDDPAVQSENEKIARMKRQIDEGVEILRATLSAQLDLAINRLKSVETMKDELREEAIKRGLDAQEYVDVKRAFEKELERLQTLKIQQMGETIAAKIPQDSVLIHENPVVANSPVSPNVGLNLLLGTAFGTLLSPLMAVLLIWVMDRLMPTKLVDAAAGS